MDAARGSVYFTLGVLEELWFDLSDAFHLLLDLTGLRVVVEATKNHRTRNYGRHRSLVRQVGSSLPLQPAKRVVFHDIALELASKHSSESGHTNVTEANFMGLNNICDFKTEDIFEDWGETMGAKPDVICVNTNSQFLENKEKFPRSSTPIGVGDMSISTINIGSEKLNALEEELARLRNQVAQIVLSNESKVHLSKHNSIESVQFQPQLNTNSVLPKLQSPNIQVVPPPPPPPPPLPPAPSLPPSSVFPKKTLKVEKSITESSKISSNTDKLPCMTDILKGIDKVKLKPVKRSPGGTPIREPCQVVNQDPSAILVAALKKRFSVINHDSPDKENDFVEEEDDFSSPETPFTLPDMKSRRKAWKSPLKRCQVDNSKFGQHMLRPVSQKKLFKTRPLSEVNV